MKRLALRVAVVREGSSEVRLRIRVHGDLVGSEASVLRHFMDGLSGRVPVLVELDLASVSSLDRRGAGIVVEAVERFRACGRPLVVVGGGISHEGPARAQSTRLSPLRGRCPSAEA